MKLAVLINDYNWAVDPAKYGATLAEIARTADECGFDSIAVADHVWGHPYMGGPELPELECYTTLAFLAAHTQRTRLMALVTPAHFRYPGLLAKMVTTLDVLSSGRAWLGLGAGHYEAESHGLGIPWPPTRERFEMLEETVQICLKMWAGERGDEGVFEGKHYRLERAFNAPQSLSRPHPPILIAGDGEQKTLRLVARYADACNLYPTPEIPRKLDILRQHCQAEGRDYDAIEKTSVYRFDLGEAGATDELLGKLSWLAGMGIQKVFGSLPRIDAVGTLEVVGGEVIPAVANL